MKNTVRIYLPILLWLCFSNSIRAIEQPVDTTQVYSARYCVNAFKGGVLNINRKESLVFEFTYDAAGNRTLREIGQ